MVRKCAKCWKESPLEATHCIHCGESLGDVKCGSCNEWSPLGSGFCISCGSTLELEKESIPDQPLGELVTNENKISLSQFISLLEGKYGQSLKSQTRIGAEDFWKYLENIKDGILSDEIEITIDMFSIARAFSEYASHQTWKGLSILFLVAAVPLFFYNWIFGALSIVVGVVVKVLGNIVLGSNGQRFVRDIVDGMRKNDLNSGLGSLCAYYLSGMIQLSSAKGYSRWPHFPSNVITGIQATVEEGDK